MRAKTVIILIVYMILVYTSVHVYTAASTEFVPGGSQASLLNDTTPDSQGVNSIMFHNYSSTSRAYRFSVLNTTYGEYQGFKHRFPGGNWNPMNWVATMRHEWLNDAGEYHHMTDLEFLEYVNGNYTGPARNWWEQVMSFFGTVWDGFGYAINLLFFNIANDNLVMTDGSTLPSYLTWLPMIMVLPVWIIVTYGLLPYAIRMINAIGNLIPFT